MRPSLTLFELIKSLSDEEKTLFLKNADLQQGDKNYLKLFKYIDKEPEYDEEMVKQYFKKETFVKHIASEKNQLFKHVLKSLRDNRIREKNSAKTYECVKNIRILAAKNLFELAEIESKCIREMAYKEELFYSLLDLIESEINLVNTCYTDCEVRVKKINALLDEKNECLNKIITLNNYQEILGQIQYYFDRNLLVHDKSKKHILDNFLNHELLNNLENINSTKALLLATYSRMVCFRLTKDFDKLGNEIQKAIELFNQNNFLIEEYPKLYIHLYGFYARYSAITANLAKAKDSIEHIREIKTHPSFKTDDLQNTIFCRLTVYDLIFYTYSGQYQKALELAPAIEEVMLTKANRLPKIELTTINFLMFVANFSVGNYSQSLKYINEIVNSDYEESRQDLFRLAKICNLIVHYELYNDEFLEYSYKSTKRFFNKIDFPFEYEIAFIKYFRLMTISKKKEESKKQIFIEFRNKLTEIFKDPYQAIATEYFDLIAWVSSHINETTYAQEIQNIRELNK